MSTVLINDLLASIKASKVPANETPAGFVYTVLPNSNKAVNLLAIETLGSLLKEFRPADAPNGIVKFNLNGLTGYTHFSERTRVCKFDGDFNGLVSIGHNDNGIVVTTANQL
jgi:hypothetical protein